MFKVVADQLKVSQGWVRCGHCSEVFDASLHLQPAQVSPPPVQPGPPSQDFVEQPNEGHVPGTAPAPFQPVQQPVSAQEMEDDPSWTPGVFFNGHAPVPGLGPVPAPFIPPAAAGQSSPEGRNIGNDGAGADPHNPALHEPFEPAGIDAQEYGEAVRVMAAEAQAQDEDHQSTSLYTQDPVRGEFPDESETSHDVSFVRDAKRKAFWRKPGIRVSLVLCSLLLMAALVLQVAVQQRDQIAALQPDLKPLLGALCEQLHCNVGALRRIEAVVIDSSTFNKMDADSYRLSFSLKNTGTMPVAMPSLEVTLTDMQDQAVVRRVLTPAQFGASVPMLTAGADFAGFVVMQVLPSDASAAATALRVSGYRMLAFYP